MNRNCIFSIGIIVSLYLAGCKHATESNDPPRKDPRTYTWTIDTIYLPGSYQTMMRAIWGSSPTDIYVTGHNSNNPGQMYHFDGTKWEEVHLYRERGGSIDLYVDMLSIFGFSRQDIWAAGYGGERVNNHIIHFNGSTWTTVAMPYENIGTSLTAIGGSSSRDLFVGGNNSNYIFHYDGSLWRKDSLPIIIPPLYHSGDFFTLQSIVSDNSDNVFAIGTSHYQTEYPSTYDVNYFFSWKNSKWDLVDSAVFASWSIQEKWGYHSLWVSPSNTLYSGGGGIFVKKDNAWQLMYLPRGYINSVSGTSDNNIFAVGDYGVILHYNGTDWYSLPVFNDSNNAYYDIWTDGNEVFIVGIISAYPMKSIVVHGK
ncbi:MAG TPA: hypothetical protein VK470_20205 [Bacteroidota bacterium]|nr:hypothetical protein [Bacteroidota bacterium]